MSRSSFSPLHDIFFANCQRSICISVGGLIPLPQHMLLSHPLTRSILRKVHGHDQCRLLGGSASEFCPSRLVFQYCTSSSSSLIHLGACQTPRGLNRSSQVVYSSLVPFSSIS